MSGINERAAARIMKDVLGEASCKTDVLANIGPQLRNGNGAEAQKGKNCEPTEVDGCNAMPQPRQAAHFQHARLTAPAVRAAPPREGRPTPDAQPHRALGI